MRNRYFIVLAGLFMVVFMGCGAAEPPIKAGDPTTKNSLAPPDTTRFAVRSHKGQSTTDKRLSAVSAPHGF